MDKPKKTEAEQIRFFEQCRDKYRQAASLTGEKKFYYNIADTIVCISFAGEEMIPVITPALEHLRIDESIEPGITLNVWDSKSTSVEMVPPPCERACFTDRGDIWGFGSQRIKTAFHWGEFSVNVMDLQAREGVFWVQSKETVPYWVYSSPLRTLIHWWMEKNQKQLVHAAAIGTDKGAVLITGKGGVGKSTTALNCLQHGMYYLSDDYVIVGKAPAFVYSLYNTAKIDAAEAGQYTYYSKYMEDHLKPKQEKTVLGLYPGLKDKIKNKLPLKAILTPEITGRKNSDIVAVPLWTIRKAMSFTTMSQLPYAGEQTISFFNELSNELPCNTLELGSEQDKIPDLISNFLENPDIHHNKMKPEIHEDINDKNKPLISIIMPVYNGEEFIEEAIENILSQHYPAIEIIIVDDGSTDGSEKIIRNLPVDLRYFYQENDGPASARNRGIKEASGEFIAFLDVDDLWPENQLNLHLKQLIDNTGLQVIRGYAQLLEKSQEGDDWTYSGNPKESFPGYIGACMYRKNVFNEVGLFDPFLRFGEDADWFKRASEMDIEMKRLDEVSLFVRRHEKNMTGGKNLVELNALRVFKKSLDRMRQPGSGKNDISVIIPVYNTEKYLAQAIESVLAQEPRPVEIIVVDDGSTDKSIEVARTFSDEIKLLLQENKGAAAARNHGISMASATYIAFLDADDVWLPDHTASLLKVFYDKPETEMVFGKVEQFISPELEGKQKNQLNDEMKVMQGYHPGAMLAKREVFLKVGLLNETLELAEFIDWFNRATEMNINTRMLPQIVMKRRIHTSNQGILKTENRSDYVSVIRAAMERRRK